MKNLTAEGAMDLVRSHFDERGIATLSIEAKSYPDETIIVIRVRQQDHKDSIEIGNRLDGVLANKDFKGFVAVRAEPSSAAPEEGPLAKGVHDNRALQLATLLAGRARTSEVQPSLSYLTDVDNNINRVMSQRHYLVFGRRGAGKTALMLEAKKRADDVGDHTIWTNVQTHRGQSGEVAALWLYQAVCDCILSHFSDSRRPPSVAELAASLRERIDGVLGSKNQRKQHEQIRSDLPPRMRQLVRRFVDTTQRRLLLFVDDLHYMSKSEQPRFLDLAHAAIRDSNAWLKVATIRHLSRWYVSKPPTGLQTGHDAAHIDLDLSLQEPEKAKAFLEQVLHSYAKHSNINFLSAVFNGDALNRLILASGGVPRDYIELSAASIREAQKRDNAKLVGVQDVNRAAGNAAAVKLSEIEEDVSGEEEVPIVTSTLNIVRNFCLDEFRFSYFRVDFRDRESHPREYAVIQSLLDLRLLHLIHSSVSEQHSAGRRSEVLMLDLSQFSGERLKKGLTVLDLEDGMLVMKVTGAKSRQTMATTPKKLLELLRRGPMFELSSLKTKSG